MRLEEYKIQEENKELERIRNEKFSIKNGEITETEIQASLSHIMSEWYMNIDWQDVIQEYLIDLNEDDCEVVLEILEEMLISENW